MSKTLLFGALDWGLGHATRSIPLLSYFHEKGWKIVIAANEGPKKILQEAFPDAKIVEPPAYHIQYSQQSSFFIFYLLLQVPKIKRVIAAEKRWVKGYVAEHPVDLILSDNRYGFYHASIPSLILTHQLSPISGWGMMIDNIVRQLHYRLLKPFDRILVPDVQAAPGIAGRLSHPSALPPNTQYIGLLSRLTNVEQLQIDVPKLELVIVLSGPEPSRSIVEALIRKQIKDFKGKYILVQGLPNGADKKEPHIIPYADPQTLLALIQKAELVICRSGYSSVMDLLALRKKAIFIPTPGQTEQLYLAAHLEKMGLFTSMQQDEFHLEKAIEKAKAFQPPSIENAFEQYKKVLEGLINEYKN
ncbi:MAG: glycosyltransferase [Sphingobacteriales bacterium]